MAALAIARRRDPYREWYFAFLQGLSEFGNERFEDAADSFEKAIELNPDLWSEAAGCGCNPFLVLLATYGHLDRQQSVNKLRDKILGNTEADIESVLSWWPYKRDKDKDRLAAGLRKAKTTL